MVKGTKNFCDQRPKLPQSSLQASFSCSSAQTRFWYEEQLQPDTSARHIFARWRVEGDISAIQLSMAWAALVARHASLRTAIINDDGEPRQVVEPNVDFHVREIDLTLLSPSDADSEVDRIALLEARTPFDLTVAPLLRVLHVRVSERVSILMVTAHHLIADGWSFGILAREMGTIMAALQARASVDLPPTKSNYLDYAERENAQLANNALDGQKVRASELLDGYRRFELRTDFPRPVTQTTNGEIVSVLLDRELTNALATLAREHMCTLFMVSYGALLVLLHRETRETDIAISTQIAGRDDPDIENVVGTFVNTIPLRTRFDAGTRFVDLLDTVRDSVSDAFELRELPFGALVEIVNRKRDLSRSVLFSVNFIFQRSFIENAKYGPFKLIDLPSYTVGSMYDVCFFMVERPEGWRFSAEFNSDLFAAETVRGLLYRYEALLRGIVSNATAPISSYALPDSVRPAASANVAQEPTVSGNFVDHEDLDPDAHRTEIRDIVRTLLENDHIAVDDDLFASGLHSLLAMRLIARIKRSRGIDVPLRALFEHPTIAALSERLNVMQDVLQPVAAIDPIVLLNPAGTLVPFIFFHGDLTADGLYCRRLASDLGPDQPVFAVAPHGTAGLPAFASVEEMAADYLERVRAIRPTGPYRLGGYCLGGLVAYEIARLLSMQGETSDRIVLVNSVALPQKAIAAFDRLVRRIGLSATFDRKLRARLCYNAAWLHAVFVSGPIGAVRLVIERFTKLRNRREPVWQMSEYPAEKRDEAERAVAYVNAAAFTYHLKPYPGDITLIWGEDQDVCGEHTAAEWRSVARNARLLLMRGGRAGPLNTHIKDFAVALKEALHG